MRDPSDAAAGAGHRDTPAEHLPTAHALAVPACTEPTLKSNLPSSSSTRVLDWAARASDPGQTRARGNRHNSPRAQQPKSPIALRDRSEA
jgi:hypothetical protein